MILLSAREREAIVVRFEASLQALGIMVRSGSPLERFSLSAFQLAYGRLESARSYERDVRDLYREMIGVTEFAATVLRTIEGGRTATIAPHLALLASGDPIQTTRSAGSDTSGNKLFELLIGCAAIECGVSPSLESPRGSSVPHPDVLTLIRGQRWGFACKVPFSKGPQSVLSNVESGIAQIEKSSAEVGAVVLSARSLLNHDAYFRITNAEAVENGAAPLFRVFESADAAKAQVEHDIQAFGKSLLEHASLDGLRTMFRGKRALPVIAFWCQTVGAIPDRHRRPRALGISFLSLQSVEDPTDGQHAVFRCISSALQSALPA